MEALKNLFRKGKDIPTENTFERDGKITPEQFVAAGDTLIDKCPAWRWSGGDPSRALPYLPPNKQFLVTQRVPCRRRVASLMAQHADETQIEGEAETGGEWLVPDGTPTAAATPPTSASSAPPAASSSSSASIPDPAPAAARATEADASAESAGDDDEMGGMMLPSEHDDPAALKAPATVAVAVGAGGSAPAGFRTYDVCITYDILYQSPRVWLIGYAEDGTTPLTREQIFEDISEDHARKTVTLEQHPHLGVSYATIHPCKHASLMKRFVDRLAAENKTLGPRQYFFQFLKFMSAVIPTIEYGYTIEMESL